MVHIIRNISMNVCILVSTNVPVWVKKGTISFPYDSTPVIMVGPGTGVAPFRSFIQHRTSTDGLGKYAIYWKHCKNFN